jgi:hypothetical protein
LRVRQELLQVVEVGAGGAVGGDPIEQQGAVVTPDEARDRRQGRAAGRLQLVGGQVVRRQLGRGAVRGAIAAGQPGAQRQRERQRARQSNVPRRIIAAIVK